MSAAATVPLGASQPADPWIQGIRFEGPAARETFEALRKLHPEDTRLKLGYASSLLNRQPSTAANVEQAAKLLHEVSTSGDALASHRATARYLLGRVAHDHQSPSDLDAARRHYRAVIEEFPDHPLAGEAAVHLGFILRWNTPALSPAEIVDGLAKLANAATANTARRELLLLLSAVKREELNDKAGALEAAITARAIGFESPGRNGDVDLLIASLSMELGDPATALSHYRAFIRNHPRDNRTSTVRQLAARLEPSVATAP